MNDSGHGSLTVAAGRVVATFRRQIRHLRNSSLVVFFLSIKNTFFPIPIARVGTKVYVGRDIIVREAEPWRRAIHHDWSLYRTVDEPARVLLSEVERVARKDDRVLDICCNVGRHLNFLASRGFTNLVGFDVMESAIARAPIEFPLLRGVEMVASNALDFYSSTPEASFDWAYTHSATIELVHPSFRFEREIFRTVRKGAILLIDPKGHRYPRFYRHLFQAAGFLVDSAHPVGDRLELFVLRKHEDVPRS